MKKTEKCKDCNGTGVIYAGRISFKCLRCKGTGECSKKRNNK